MSIQTNDKDLTGETGTIQAPTPKTAIPQPGHMTLQAMNASIGSISALTIEARTYVENVTDMITQYSGAIISGIKKIELNIPGMVAFVHERKAYLLVLADGVRTNPRIPTAHVTTEGLRKLTGDGYQVVNSIVIAREDYPKSSEMAQTIIREMACFNNPAYAFTIEHLSKEQYEISTNVEEVKNHIRAHSPHGVESRVDIGFTLSMRTTEVAGYTANSFGGYGNNNTVPTTPFLSVGAYVDFIEVPRPNSNYAMGGFPLGQQQMMYQPIINITEIVSDIRASHMIIPALVIAAEVFIRGQAWKNQFMNFAAGRPNIGNLISETDEAGNRKPYQVENLQQFNDFVNIWCGVPQIALRIAEGRSRMPGMTAFLNTDTKAIAQLCSQFGQFFMTNFVHNEAAAHNLATVIAGSVQMGVGVVDSRNIDFLSASAMGLGEAEVAMLRFHDEDALRRADLISQISGNTFTRRYVDFVAVLNWKLLSTLVQMSAGRLRFAGGYNQGNGAVAHDYIVAQMLMQQQSPLHAIQSIAPMNNPMGVTMNQMGFYA